MAETVSDELAVLFDLMDEADDALDKDTYDQFSRDEFDPQNDSDYSVRAGTIIKCNKVFKAIEQLRRRPPDPAVAELVEALRRSYARLGDAATRINTLPRTTDTLLEVNLRQERSRIESLLAKHAAKP
jgi:hypothetical protein